MTRLAHQWFARWLAFCLMALLVMQGTARAAEAVFTVDQLDQMLAPVALFPDPLLSQVLMAATYPEEVAQAANWAFANRSLEGDAAVRAVQNQDWDPSVQSLVAFPQVIAMMGENPDWVRDLGDAFLSDPEGVMDSVQFLRAKARDAGNLSSNAQQIVQVEAAPPRTQMVVVETHRPPQQIIVIEPANPQVVFVPVYNPNVVFGTWWNPWAPPMFFPPPPRWGFTETVVGTAIAWGVGIGISNALWGNMNWRNNSVNVNVNHWNNININNRINSNNREINWRRNEINRPGVPPRDRNTITRERARDIAANRGNNRPDNRPSNRPGQAVNDDRRAQARDALSNRVGAENLNRDALRNVDRSQLPNRGGTIDRNQAQNRLSNVDREQARQRAANVDRTQLQNRAANVNRDQARQRAAAVDRTQAQNRAATVNRDQVRERAATVDRSQVQNRAANVDREQARQRASTIDRSQVQTRANNRANTQANPQARPQIRQQEATRINRDNAVRGANNGAQTTRQIDRGAASQRIANNPQAAQRAANNPQVRQRVANNPQAAQRAANNPQVRQRAAERRGGQ